MHSCIPCEPAELRGPYKNSVPAGKCFCIQQGEKLAWDASAGCGCMGEQSKQKAPGHWERSDTFKGRSFIPEKHCLLEKPQKVVASLRKLIVHLGKGGC